MTYLLVMLFFAPLIFARAKLLAVNEVAIEFPTDGGGMLMLSRMWGWGRYVRVGLTAGGGVIERDFELTIQNGVKLDAKTKALVLPYVAPRLSFHYHVIGISLAYGLFHATTDFDVKGPGIGPLSGDETGIGTGFYSPVLSVDFYNKKHDIVIGLGFGGFFGSTYPTLEATSGPTKVTTDESPVDTLTFHVRFRWADGRKYKMTGTDDEF